MVGIDKTPIQCSCLKTLHLEQSTALSASEVPPGTCADDPSLLTNSPRVSHNRHRRKLYTRGIVFVLFELAFLIFAYYTLLHPIPLQSTPQDELILLSSFTVTLTELKAGLTAAAVVWHMIACFFVKDIIAVVCSAEFMTQYQQSGALVPGKSDRVSTMTSGIIDNVVHCFGKSASREFRLAFMMTVILMTVGPLGSGTVTIGTLSRSLTQAISVANVTVDFDAEASDDITKQANAVMRLEGIGNTLFGYQMNSDGNMDTVLIPWPNVDEGDNPEGARIVYNSDIVRFHYECSWVPNVNFSLYPNASLLSFNLQPSGYRFKSSNNNEITYATGVFDSGEGPMGSGVIRLERNHDHSKIIDAYHEIQRLAFLFFNQISIDLRGSEGVDPTPGRTNLSLSGIEEAFVTILVPPNRASESLGMGMDFAILECDPHALVVSGKVTLSQNSLVVKQSTLGMNESALTGNVIRTGLLPSFPFTVAFDEERSSMTSGDPTKLVKDLFLQARRVWLPGLEHELGLVHTVVELEPLPLDEINRKLNQYAQSASKAFLDSSSMVTNGTALGQLVMNQTAEVFFPVAALVASEPFLISFTVIVIAIIAVFTLLFWTIREKELQIFDLRSLVGLLGTK
ncbi:hypothetical protein NP233_g11189 [Leucocoprinus birnbaumii]|uniref:Uncharacterized protein n=1 Tax=Leucocoprinus birnbaumii TaxID=56174 RepID=A0AAD5YKM9_9AGAR|nr:hypothetical protein NP233_g11189 [Leucocoprinus birnbaumii]